MNTYCETFVSFEWGFGHSQYSVPETVEHMTQFKKLKPDTIRVDFVETEEVYERNLLTFEEAGEPYAHTSLQFEWGFGHSLDIVPETVESLKPYDDFTPNSVTVTFKNSDVRYYGEFFNSRIATPRLVRSLELQPDEPVWQHLKNNPHLWQEEV